MTDDGKRLILVAGIGRSGTSVCAGVLSRLGYRVPQPEVNPNKTNPKGFGEPQWAVDFHNRLLRRSLVAVWDARPDAWARTAEQSAKEAVVAECRDWLAEHFDGTERVVVKDPRTIWFLGVWERAARDLGAQVATVTMLRHPAEAIGSALKYYNTWENATSRSTGWLNVMLQTEAATRHLPRAFVLYPSLLADWQSEIRRVGESIGDAALVDIDPDAKGEVDEFVDPSLSRTDSGWGYLDVPERVTTLAEDVWQRLTTLAGPTSDEGEVRSALDRARSTYDELYGEAENIALATLHALRRDQFGAKKSNAAAKTQAPDPPRARLFSGLRRRKG